MRLNSTLKSDFDKIQTGYRVVGSVIGSVIGEILSKTVVIPQQMMMWNVQILDGIKWDSFWD